MWETAVDFGYHVSNDVALRSPGVVEQVEQPSWWRRPKTRRFKGRLAIALLVATPFGGFLPNPWALPAIFGCAVATGLLGMSNLPRATLHSVLSVYRWEKWPAIVEEIGAPDTQRNATVVFTLLRPDGRPHRGVRLQVFHWPPQAYNRLQRLECVEVWFAGDLRFGGAVALPGGAHPAMAAAHGYGRFAGTNAENDIAQQAGFRIHPLHRRSP